jgi:peptidyl-prolyl cis-trans isomerase SurA
MRWNCVKTMLKFTPAKGDAGQTPYFSPMNRSTRTLTILTFLFALGITHAVAQETRLIDKIVGAVGGEVILLSEIEQQMAYLKAQRGSVPPDARCMVMENLLAQNLMLHRARMDSIQISDEEVESQIEARIDRILAMMNNDFQQFEDYYGKSVSEVRQEMRDPIRNQALVERMQGKVFSAITITPSEVRTFFARVPRDSLPYFNSEVEMAEFIYFPKVNQEQKQLAYARISGLRKQIGEEGKSFAEVASAHSDDLGSARLAGDLGWQKRGTFVPEFEAVAYNLEPGEISEVFESPFGYHFVQLLERRGNLLHTRHVLVMPRIEQSDLDLAVRFLDSIRQRIATEEGYTFETALKAHGDKNNQSFNNGGRMLNPQTGNTFFEISDLDHRLFFVIDTLEVGQISAPIQQTDPTGKIYFQVIKLLSRTKPHKASLKQDYSRIQEAALSEKKGKYLDEWVEKHIRNTYIDLDAQYQGCPNLTPWIKATGDTVKP